jgi:hypothetical protein
MSDMQFRHDWESHIWRSAVTQGPKGYVSCRNCGRAEWVSGAVEEGTMSEAQCQAMQDNMIGRPQFIQGQLFDWSPG